MTTLPSGPEGTSATGTGGYDRARPHLQRQVAEGFGADAGRYDRARPTYPAGLVERIVAASPGRDVLDVGCGTGISARLFQAAGCRVLGVDPDPRMAELARQGGPRPRSRSSRTGTRPAARSTRSSPRRPGTGWTRSRARRRPPRCCAPAAGSRCSGTPSTRRGPARGVRRGLPPGAAGLAVRRLLGEARHRRLPGRVRQGGRRDAAGGGVRRAGGVAVRLGAALHPGRVAGPGADPRRLQPAPEAVQAELLAGLGAAVDAAGGAFTWLHHVAVTAVRLAS